MNIYQDPKDLAKSHLANLIRLAKADEQIHHHEIIFIQSLAVKMGLTDFEFQAVVKDPDRITFKVAYDEEVKLEHYFQTLTLMNIDFNAHSKEQEFCLELGKKMRIPSYHCSRMIEFMVNNVGEIISYTEFKSQIQG